MSLRPLDGSSSVPLPAGADKPAAPPAGPQIRQGDADTIREAPQKLAKARIEELEGKLGSRAATQSKSLLPKRGHMGLVQGVLPHNSIMEYIRQTQRNLAISMH
ncbi:MAG: hypothetical protein LBF34_02360 [Puniceicoccales bacterium]|jgi:hypothetical protein|nr:hypothetical protein [Puniceicoccales bacterium]